MMHSFFRWQSVPVGLVPPGFTALPTQTLGGPCEEAAIGYSLPAKPGDEFHFLTENHGPRGGVALLRNGLLVVPNAGSIAAESPLAPWQVTVNFPVDLGEGCYQLLLYRTPLVWSDWAETSRGCELNPQGQTTGFALVTESRTGTEGAPIALLVSNSIEVGEHWETKIVRFQDTRRAFGFDYPNAAAFFHQVRLPLYVSKPTYPVKEKVYRQSNGVFRTANVTVDKKIEVATGYLDEPTHAALAVAVKHERFFVNTQPLSVQGEIDYEFFETFDSDNGYYPLAVAKLEAYEQAYNQTNFGCGSREEEALAGYPCSPLQYTVAVEGVGVADFSVNWLAGQVGQVVYTFYPAARALTARVQGELPTGLAVSVDCGKLLLSGLPTESGSRVLNLEVRTEEGYCLLTTLNLVVAPMVDTGVFDYTFDLTFS